MNSNEPVATAPEEVPQPAHKPSRQKTNVACAHCHQILEKEKNALVSMYYDKIIRGGGINRMKGHFTRDPGKVYQCPKVPDEVQVKMQASIYEVKVKKRKVEREYKESNSVDGHSMTPDERVEEVAMPEPPPSKSQKGKDTGRMTGSGYKALIFHRVRDFLLNKWVDETKKLVESYLDVWRRIADMLFKLFKEVILYIDPGIFVQVVTDNAANYVAAGRLLEAEFPKLYWSPCAAHCVNLMFQDIGKVAEVTETVSQAYNITKYIYNHCFALSLMRKHTNNREILRPAPTRFATNFIALQSILAQMDPLRAMVVDKEWTTSTYARDTKVKKFVEQVLNSGFWKKCADIVKLTKPLVRLLRLVDSEDKPTMGFLYQSFYKNREEMAKRFQRNKKKVEPYLKTIDNRWDSQLRKNIHATGYWLNPGCWFNRDEFEKHESTISGLLDDIDRYSSGDTELNDKLTSEKRLFKDAELDFGRQSVIRERKLCQINGGNLMDVVHKICKRWLSVNRLMQQSYDPINFEVSDDHSDWVMEDSPPFLTLEEVNALRNDLANMTIQSIPNDIDLNLNLFDDDDDAQDNIIESANENESNVGGGEAFGLFDEVMLDLDET
ncbi:uncharacterized protein LOC130719161 [Lotus japonicus]|uniref:uncharacterized protein LOC130719161 n=1 Tax=Lotus japonicus TaxID=34305 RepID=UPI002590601F|nr:uncharacterized protein LOC130719161 [Lotus japonicus]